MVDRERPGVAEKRQRLSDPEIRKWYDNLARGSEITASNYLRSLHGFATRTGTTPHAVAKLSKKEAYRALLDFVSAEQKRGIAGSAVVTYVKAVKSWLAFNDVIVDQRIKVEGAQATPTLENEVVPTQEQLRQVLLAANPKVRVAVALLAFSGVRPEVIGDYRGTDGLRVKDLPDLVVGTDPSTRKPTVRFEALPARVVVRPELSKTGSRYFSWLGTEGAGYVTSFLEERVRAGERIGPESDVYHSDASGKPFVKTTRVSESVRAAIDRAGLDFRPYNLRCYFDTQLLLAESKGKVAGDFRVFWMGHRGKIDAVYTTNKGRLPKDLLDEMRQAYRRAEQFLSTVPTGDEKAERDAQIRAEFLKLAGYGEEEAERIAHDATADVTKLIHERLRALTPRSSEAAVATPKRSGEQRVVEADATEQYLAAGWTFKSPLNGSKAVVEWLGEVPSARQA